ncbi:alpha/beta fold hydrolase [Microbacterium sp. PMB16]|uniref:alpha/beta fold hydrolase n=1 Tax=Microbacterium sp. PMB16 TaxID=3120157 RepID=UPI003F4C0340
MARRSVGTFRSDRAREEFLDAYEKVSSHWPVPHEERDVETSFGPTHVRISGSGDGTPLVLLHPLAGTSLSWAPLVAELGADRTVFAIDTIGTAGRSVQTRSVTDGVDFAAWLDEVIRAVTTSRVHLVGYSNGAWHAAMAALHHGDTLASVTLLEMGGGLVRVPLRTLLAFLRAGARPTAANLAALDALIAPGVESHADEQNLARAALSFRSTLPWGTTLSDAEPRSITAPTLVLFGDETTIGDPRKAVARARAHIADVDAEIVPGAGHGLPFQRPTEVTRRILKFVSAHE